MGKEAGLHFVKRIQLIDQRRIWLKPIQKIILQLKLEAIQKTVAAGELNLAYKKELKNISFVAR